MFRSPHDNGIMQSDTSLAVVLDALSTSRHPLEMPSVTVLILEQWRRYYI